MAWRTCSSSLQQRDAITGHQFKSQTRHAARLRAFKEIEDKIDGRFAALERHLLQKCGATGVANPFGHASQDAGVLDEPRLVSLEQRLFQMEKKMETMLTPADLGASLQTVLDANGLSNVSGRFDSMEMVTRNAHDQNVVMFEQLAAKFEVSEATLQELCDNGTQQDQRLSILEAQSEALARRITGSGISGKGSSSGTTSGNSGSGPVTKVCSSSGPATKGTASNVPGMDAVGMRRGSTSSMAEPGQRKANVSDGSFSGLAAKGSSSSGPATKGTASNVPGSDAVGKCRGSTSSKAEPGQRKAHVSGGSFSGLATKGSKGVDYTRFDHIGDSDDETSTDGEVPQGVCFLCNDREGTAYFDGELVCARCEKLVKVKRDTG